MFGANNVKNEARITVTVKLHYPVGETATVHLKRVVSDYPTVVIYGGSVFLNLQVLRPGHGYQPDEYEQVDSHFVGIHDYHVV